MGHDDKLLVSGKLDKSSRLSFKKPRGGIFVLFDAGPGWAKAGALPGALAYGFVVNAVLGGLGTLVVVKRFAFFSEAVGHSALTGVAIGILLGEPYTGPYGSLFGYCLLFGIS